MLILALLVYMMIMVGYFVGHSHAVDFRAAWLAYLVISLVWPVWVGVYLCALGSHDGLDAS